MTMIERVARAIEEGYDNQFTFAEIAKMVIEEVSTCRWPKCSCGYGECGALNPHLVDAALNEKSDDHLA